MRYVYRFSKALVDQFATMDHVPESRPPEEVRQAAREQLGEGTLYVEVPEPESDGSQTAADVFVLDASRPPNTPTGEQVFALDAERAEQPVAPVVEPELGSPTGVVAAADQIDAPAL